MGMIKHQNMIQNWEKDFQIPSVFLAQNQKDFLHIHRINVRKNMDWVQNRKTCLSDEERATHSRIVRPTDKNLFLTSKVGVKALCAAYLGCSAEEVLISQDKFEKPFLKNNYELHFNISHSGVWVMFAFSSRPCGIDVERIDPDFDFKELMGLVFHPAEIAHVLCSNTPRFEFFRLWTGKESLLKAMGLGLVDNLAEVNMLADFKALPPNLLGFSSDWTVRDFLLEEDYFCSITYQVQGCGIKYFEFEEQLPIYPLSGKTEKGA